MRVFLLLLCFLVSLVWMEEMKYTFSHIKIQKSKFESSIKPKIDMLKFQSFIISSKDDIPLTCYLPKDEEEITQHTLPAQDLPTLPDILEEIDDCISKTNGWWTVDFCPKKGHVRQFHVDYQTLKESGDDFYLGYAPEMGSEVMEVGDKYISTNYIDGDICDLTKEARTSEIRFLCASLDPESTVYIQSITETTTCQYRIEVHSPLLCQYSKFQPKTLIFQPITCYEILEPVNHQRFKNAKTVDISLVPVENGHVSGGEGRNTHFDPGMSLQARHSDLPNGRWKIFLKFDLKNIDRDLLKEAFLYLHPKSVSNVQEGGKFEIAKVSSDWDEDKLTWNNRPRQKEIIAEWEGPKEGQDFKIEVSDVVHQALINAEPHLSIVISAKESVGHKGRVTFSLKNDVNTESIPRLEMTIYSL